MPAVARIGDTISHGGTIVSGSSITNDQGTPIARVGDLVTCNIHGGQTIAMGSTSRFDLDGPAIARLGDNTSCGATITSGDANVIVN